MAYLQQPLPVPSSDLNQFSLNRFPSTNYHTNTFSHPNSTVNNDEPIYYYTIAQGNMRNLPPPSLYRGRESAKRLYSYRSYDDVYMNPYRHNCFLKCNTSIPWMASSSRESGACQRDSTIYQNCSYRCIYNCQKNLTTTFQSRSDDIWQVV
ncbi:Protein UNUSUAL FLORAL ORGANS [Dirofilaria immitis]